MKEEKGHEREGGEPGLHSVPASMIRWNRQTYTVRKNCNVPLEPKQHASGSYIYSDSPPIFLYIGGSKKKKAVGRCRDREYREQRDSYLIFV